MCVPLERNERDLSSRVLRAMRNLEYEHVLSVMCMLATCTRGSDAVLCTSLTVLLVLVALLVPLALWGLRIVRDGPALFCPRKFTSCCLSLWQRHEEFQLPRERPVFLNVGGCNVHMAASLAGSDPKVDYCRGHDGGCSGGRV